MTGRSTTDRQAIEAAERRAKAIGLRKAGASYDAIAKACGYANRGSAYNAIKDEMGKARENATELLELENARLDDALRAIYPAMLRGDLGAVAAFLKISERRAKLNGLDDYESRLAAVAERGAALEEAQALMMARVLANTVNKLELDPAQKAIAAEIVTAELEALDSAH
jgi:hypothetical protein